MAVDSDKFIIWHSGSTICSIVCFNSLGLILSNPQLVFGFNLCTIFRISMGVTGVKKKLWGILLLVVGSMGN